MKKLALLYLTLFVLSGCTTKEYKNYVTNNTGPVDWQGPEVIWQTPSEAAMRGRVAIDVNAMDSSRVDSVILYVDGLKWQTHIVEPYRFEIQSDSLEDGLHLLEARAWDNFGNLGVSTILRIRVQNQPLSGPRLFWVPDNYTLIQSAINAADDYDTLRVRDGNYNETLNLFGKGVWLESEHGPLTTIIDGQYAQNTIFTIASRACITVRGFTIRNAGGITVQFDDGSQFSFMNNIAIADSAEAIIYARRTGGIIQNNIFLARFLCVEIWSLQGSVLNNIFENASVAAMWNTNYGRNPVQYDYNLFWNVETDYSGFLPAASDLHADPMLDLVNGLLLPGSPCIDHGDSTILDRNGTRSDIGPFGGPWAY